MRVEKKEISILVLCVLLSRCLMARSEEQVELVPYGDFESWTVRYIKESGLIGGNIKKLYMVGPSDTIYGNKPYTPSPLSPWGSGNTHARAFGVDKASISVTPERRTDQDGYCCRMETRLESVKAGVLDLNAIATGSVYTGRLLDPVGMAQSSDPNSGLDMGIPFNRRPKALMLDYKAFIQSGEGILYAPASSKIKPVAGHDEGQIILILQHRWEENGHVYAYRVGTAVEHISHSTNGWVNDHRVHVVYGPVPPRADYKEWQWLTNKRYKTHNSKGKMVYIEEKEWRGDIEPTHLIIKISAGCQKPFTGRPGNVVCCDNIRLVY